MSTEKKPFQAVQFNAPFNKEVSLKESQYDNGFPVLQLRIKEGSRFTTMELDPETAKKWGELMVEWADKCGTEFLSDQDIK